MKDHPSIELIGSGGFGSVFLLKQYNPPMVMKENDHCPNSFDQQQELKILKDLMHENIVKYLDQPIDFEWKKNGNLIFMEYCEKGALKHVITNVQINYSIATIIAWGRDIFKALNFYKSDVYGAGLVLWEVIERKHFSTEVKTICFSPSDCLKVEKLQNLIIWCSCSKIDVEKRATAVQALEKIAYLEKCWTVL
ncbi:unnamed protein product, partial [Mesorhabditis belari]|uniref:non-specific serine/threonine protein kinase n=1 Tax=Mesorhabditis belari TaxID=2138241 RepID=A0AAF3EIX8_9BILA